MINGNFVILGALISFIGNCSYLIDTIRGKVQPNRVSWLLWSVVPLIAFFAEIKQGVGLQSLTTFMIGFNPLFIFFASFLHKESTWRSGRFDIICGLLSVVGLHLATTISAFITLLTIKTWDLANAGFPIYIFVLDLLLTCMIKYKPGKLPRERSWLLRK